MPFILFQNKLTYPKKLIKETRHKIQVILKLSLFSFFRLKDGFERQTTSDAVHRSDQAEPDAADPVQEPDGPRPPVLSGVAPEPQARSNQVSWRLLFCNVKIT